MVLRACKRGAGSNGSFEDAAVQTVSPPCPPSVPGQGKQGLGAGNSQSYLSSGGGGWEERLSLTPLLQMKGLGLRARCPQRGQEKRCPSTLCTDDQPIQVSLTGGTQPWGSGAGLSLGTKFSGLVGAALLIELMGFQPPDTLELR